jgi:hypothetical protein
MSIKFDFDLPEIQVSATVAASTVGVLVSIPTTTGPFPLTISMLLQLEYEVMGFDAGGTPLYVKSAVLIQGGSPPAPVLMSGNPHSTSALPGYGGGGGFVVNGSGDLDFHWSNGSSSLSQDVTIRVKSRIISV